VEDGEPLPANGTRDYLDFFKFLYKVAQMTLANEAILAVEL